jgi:hypothetical protein
MRWWRPGAFGEVWHAHGPGGLDVALKFVRIDAHMSLAYDEVVDFIAGGSTPQSVIAFRSSQETKEQVADLIRRQKANSLSTDDTAELNHYLHIEHLMRLAKARARQRLQQE